MEHTQKIIKGNLDFVHQHNNFLKIEQNRINLVYVGVRSGMKLAKERSSLKIGYIRSEVKERKKSPPKRTH